MKNEIIEKILNSSSLTKEEANSFLTYFCNIIRQDSGIINPMDTNCMVCDDTSLKFGRLMLMKFGLDVEHLDIKSLLGIPLTHYSNIIYLNVEGEIKTYLVDMTFSQFFGDKIRLDDENGKYGKLVSTKKSFKKVQDNEIINELRYKGFIPIDEAILSNYINLFLELCNIMNSSLASSVARQYLTKQERNTTYIK